MLQPSWLCGVTTVIGMLLILPFVAVSMLRSASMGVPLSWDVIKTAETYRGLWIAFYSLTLPLAYLVACPPVLCSLCNLPAAVTASAAIISIVPGLFAYCAILGAFAHRIDILLEEP